MTAKSTTSKKASPRRKRATSSRPRSSPSSSSSPKRGSPRKTKAATSKKKPPRKHGNYDAWRNGQTTNPRQRYSNIATHETIFQAWIQAGTIDGTVRKLHQIEGYESINRKTVISIKAEKAGTDDDWEKRLNGISHAVQERVRTKVETELADEIAHLEVQVRKEYLKGLVKLSKLSAKALPAALQLILDKIEDGDLNGQELVYGLPKLLDAIDKTARPRERTGSRVQVFNDNRHLTVTSPRELAERETKAALTAEVTRRERTIHDRAV